MEWPTSMKITQAAKKMYESNQFNNQDLRDWEPKSAADKTWVHCQAYFTAMYNDNKWFVNAAGNKHGLKNAANVKEQNNKRKRRKCVMAPLRNFVVGYAR